MKPNIPSNSKFYYLAILALCGLLLNSVSYAQEDSAETTDSGTPEETSSDLDESDGSDAPGEPARPHLPPPNSATTEGKVTIGGVEIPYTATAGTVTLKNEKGRPSAQIFHVSYIRKDVEDIASRPVTFCFNGGPGSSAVWLHLGGLGPKKVVLPDDGVTAPTPPGRVEDNPYAILDTTDLVFVDPVSTGFSRSQKPDGAYEFHGVVEDVYSMGDFIRRWIIENRRWRSPKFLLGESYGGLRVAALSSHIQDRYGIYLNGTILVSAVLDFSTIRSDAGNDLFYLSFLPSLAATAHYHGALADNDQAADTLRENVEKFIHDEYAPALFLGSELPEERKRALAAKMAGFIGIPEEFIFRADLRVSPKVFFKELLRSRGKVVGRFDSRVLGDDHLDMGDSPSYDPSYTNIYGAYASAMKGYVRETLNFDSDLVYEILTSKVRPWDNSAYEGRYVNVTPQLAEALKKNPQLQVLAMCGYCDLATPYFGMEHTLRHIPVDAQRLKNVSIQYYESGHMMYNNKPDLEKMRKDLVEFYEKATR